MKGYIQELFRTGLYKRTQGRMARQATFFAFAGILLFGWYLLLLSDGGLGDALDAWARNSLSLRSGLLLRYGVFVAGGLALAWACYRLVQFPTFADFLIAVEAEVNKVVWPSRDQLIRSTLVVIFLMLGLAGLLFGYDVLIRQALDLVGAAARKVFGG